MLQIGRSLARPQLVSVDFLLTKSFRSHYGPGVDSASNRNEYQEYFLWGKGGRCVRLTTYNHPVPLSRNLGSLTSWNTLGHSGPVKGLLNFYCTYNIFTAHTTFLTRIHFLLHIPHFYCTYIVYCTYHICTAHTTLFTARTTFLLYIPRFTAHTTFLTRIHFLLHIPHFYCTYHIVYCTYHICTAHTTLFTARTTFLLYIPRFTAHTTFYCTYHIFTAYTFFTAHTTFLLQIKVLVKR